MNGTGTQTTPYIPENWGEFVTAVGTTGAYVSLPEGGGTFNMNEIAPAGVGEIKINCAEINGNGWTIHSPYNMEISVGSAMTRNIYSLNITNFLNERSGGNLICAGEDSPVNLHNCRISGKKISSGNHAVFANGVYLNSCGINIAFGGNECRLFKHAYYRRNWGYFCTAQLDYTGCTADFSYNTARDGDSFAFDNSFLRIVTNPDKTQKTAFYSGSVNDIALIGSKNIVIDSSGTSHEVTDEQVRNPAYLNSIGFPIAAEG